MDKSRQNRVREALGRIYDQHPPYFREYLRRFKEDPTSRVFAPLAEAYRRMGRVDEAIDICREGLEHHPDFAGGRVALAKCYVDKKLYSEARAELERVIQYVPENLLAQRLLGEVYFSLGDRAGALHCFKMALLLSPTDVTLAERVHNLERETEESAPLDIPFETIPEETPEEALGIEEPDLITRTSVSPSADVSSADLAPLWETIANDNSDKPWDGEVTGNARPHGEGVEELPSADSDENDDAFRIEHVSTIFAERESGGKPEITTETLGDLYYSQGQYDKALRIFEKIAERKETAELSQKIRACRGKLGVDREAMIRERQIKVLRWVLERVRS